MPHKMAMKTEWQNVPALLNENMLCFNEGSAVIITSNNMTMITNYYSRQENLDMLYVFATLCFWIYLKISKLWLTTIRHSELSLIYSSSFPN